MNEEIAIKVENLSKVYYLHRPQLNVEGNETHELWALKDVSFEIRKGETVGIIGPNGSGKSTLLKILAGVTKPTSGKVTIKGKIASILDIGAGFHPDLSGRENVFLNGQLLGFSKKEIQSNFEEIVSFSGIEKFINEPVKNYSSGMFLRLAFSVLAHLDFDVYLLDEVLNVGDEEFQQKVQHFFRSTERGKLHQKTLLLTSHDKQRIISNSSQFFLMDRDNKFEIKENIIDSFEEDLVSEGANYFLDDALELGSYRIHYVKTFEDKVQLRRSFDYQQEIYIRFGISNTTASQKFPFLFQIVNSYNVSLICTSYMVQDPDYIILPESGMTELELKLPARLLSDGWYYMNVFADEGTGRFSVIKTKVIKFQVTGADKSPGVKWWPAKFPAAVNPELKWQIV